MWAAAGALCAVAGELCTEWCGVLQVSYALSQVTARVVIEKRESDVMHVVRLCLAREWGVYLSECMGAVRLVQPHDVCMGQSAP